MVHYLRVIKFSDKNIMKFAITQEVDTRSGKKSDIIQQVSNDLENYLKDKNYGSDIETFLIGFVGVKTRPGYEEWYKESLNIQLIRLLKTALQGFLWKL